MKSVAMFPCERAEKRVDNNSISRLLRVYLIGRNGIAREIRDYLFMARLMEVVPSRNGSKPRVWPILANNVARTYRAPSGRWIKLILERAGGRSSDGNAGQERDESSGQELFLLRLFRGFFDRSLALVQTFFGDETRWLSLRTIGNTNLNF